MLRIVIDGGGDIPPEWASQYDIKMIPINIHFGEQMFLQGVDLSNADFYRIVDESGVIPKTSQPTPQQFIDFYQRVARAGDTILSLHITSKLSGTLASAQIAARELAGRYHIFPIDTLSGSAAVGYMARQARILDRAGKTVEQIIQEIEKIAQQVQIILTLNTMEYARRSGRVKALQAALASLLNVKPIIYLKDGALELGHRVRTRRRALEYVVDSMAERIGTRLVNAAIAHAEDPTAAQQMIELVQRKLLCKELIITDLSIGITANLGPGTIGVIAYPAEG
jgi:DegV family protein with EDD domain